MQEAPYQKFMSLKSDQREKLLADQKPDEPGPVLLGEHKFPDFDFIKLMGTQEKKQIKLATYRFPA